MYLSKLELNPRAKQVRQDMANPYEMHRTLSRAVSEGIAVGRERLLWRIEPTRSGHPVLLMQTLTRPKWDALLQRHPGYASIDAASPKSYNPTFRPGQGLRFRLKANASVKRLGKRHALRTMEEKLTWIERKITASGFELVAAIVVAEERLRARKSDSLITVDATLFEGHIRVADPETAHMALMHGIGHAKGLGLGLLSVALERG